MYADKFFAYIASAVCHGIAERCLTVDGAPLPFCARCAGLYTGAFISFIFICVKKRSAGDFLPRPFVICAALCMAPLILDGLTSYAGLRGSDNLTRLLTGMPYGAALPFFMILANNFKPEPNGEPKTIIRIWEYMILLSIAAAAGAVLYAGWINRRAASMFICAGAVALFCLFFYMLINLIPFISSKYFKRTAAALSPFILFFVLNAARAAFGF